MKIALYGRTLYNEHLPYFDHLLKILEQKKCEIIVFESFYKDWQDRISSKAKFNVLASEKDFSHDTDFVFSIGGDGTLLNTLTFVRDSGIPILGINTGRLGFLSSVGTEEIDYAVNALFKKEFSLDQRSLVRLDTPGKLFGDLNFALNEITIHKKDSSSMITIHAFLNGKLLNSYWADGLIVSTPTGATAYSLSCGGPIVIPDCENFVITPIAPHNLNVRPIIISDKEVITLKVEGRMDNFLISLDSRSESIDSSTEITIVKERFNVNLVRLNNQDFLSTLRKKLMWGIDKRN